MLTGRQRTGHRWTRPADYDFNRTPAMELEDGTYVCARPPTGWECTREPGHDGPCAANQVVNTKSVHVPCKSYTDVVPFRNLYVEQATAAHEWMNQHDKEKHMPLDGKGKGKFRYAGAIGGAYTWEFTPTSIGEVVKVRCSCGESIDVSDYDNW